MAQIGYELDIEKPDPYGNRELKAEKSGAKKFTARKRFFQNLYTHYNYVFNANNKINDVILNAKEAHEDDYDSLLSFYNYSLNTTIEATQELDSVIYKAKTGIVMHDLRNDYIDNLYLLWGKAYFFKQQFDSAYQMFQFINYSFADKEKDGYYKYIGSRMDGNNASSIATKEKSSFPKNVISDPPSRNNAFIWQIRTLIERAAFIEAGSLISTLKKDPAFPERLQTTLEEVEALYFYRQEKWDSAALHLSNALDNTPTKGERARWEYLIGQLYQLSGKGESSKTFFSEAIDHTIDPVMELYARLNLIKLNKGESENYIDLNIAELLKMARREKYLAYRDIIYFMAAQMELERGNKEAAQAYLLKGAQYSSNSTASRNRSYMQLADLSYDQRKYKLAATYYDSLQMDNLSALDGERISGRKSFLGVLTGNFNTVERQDSLQKLANLPEAEQTAFLKKLSRQLRREQGLKEEDLLSPTSLTTTPETSPSALFQINAKGEWYFYNKTLLAQGAVLFKQTWGNRPNVDNWRRASNVMADLRNEVPEDTRDLPITGLDVATGTYTYESLLQTLPTTPEQMQQSNDSILNSLLSEGLIFINNIEDYVSAIEVYEEIRRRFPEYDGTSEVLYHLYNSYTKTGDAAKAEEIKRLLQKEHPDSRYATIVSSGVDPESDNSAAAATKIYEGIYDMFLEGRFTEAIQAKINADSIFQTKYWHPQLLYITAVYHIKEREDSKAQDILTDLITQDPMAPIAQKAEILLDVLSRRSEIEEELRNLQLEKEVEAPVVARVPARPKPIPEPEVTAEPEPEKFRNAPKDTSAVNTIKKDDVAFKPTEKNISTRQLPNVQIPQAEVVDSASTAIEPKEEVVANKIELPKTDTAIAQPVEAPTKALEKVVVKQEPIQTETAPTKDLKKDTTATLPKEMVTKKLPEVKKDTIVKAPPVATKTLHGYNFDAEAPHYAVVVLNKVDAIFVNEARNAFARYSREKSFNQQAPPVQIINLNADVKLLLIGTFTNADASIAFVQNAKEIATTQIVPWLKSDKYYFTILSEVNLQKLQQNPDISLYNEFLKLNSAVKF